MKNQHIILPYNTTSGAVPIAYSASTEGDKGIKAGELAVNLYQGQEFLVTRNENGDIIKFSSDNHDVFVKGNGTGSIKQKGSACIANGDYSFAMGYQSSATTFYAHADGHLVLASGGFSHAEGSRTTADGTNSHAEGDSTTASGSTSHAEGKDTRALGDFSHAEGSGTTADGNASHAEGNGVANGQFSHAEGGATASGTSSHAEGTGYAKGAVTHAEGKETVAIGMAAHAEGNKSSATTNYAHAEGNGTLADGGAAHAEGRQTSAFTEAAHAEGSGTTASGNCAHAEGDSTTGGGHYSHAEGQNTYAQGIATHAEGLDTHANSNAAHAEGYETKATGAYSHTEGRATSATTYEAHAEGSGTTASAEAAHAEGISTIASGTAAHAEGTGTIANNSNEHASGIYNKSHITGTNKWDDLQGATTSTDTVESFTGTSTLFSVGFGNTSFRRNALEVTKQGQTLLNSRKTYFRYADASADMGDQSYAATGATQYQTTPGVAEYITMFDVIEKVRGNDNYAVFEKGSGANSIQQRGTNCVASGANSVAIGSGTTARFSDEFVCGRYNKYPTAHIQSPTLFSIGNGINDTNRRNAVIVKLPDQISRTLPANHVEVFVSGDLHSGKFVRNGTITASTGSSSLSALTSGIGGNDSIIFINNDSYSGGTSDSIFISSGSTMLRGQTVMLYFTKPMKIGEIKTETEQAFPEIISKVKVYYHIDGSVSTTDGSSAAAFLSLYTFTAVEITKIGNRDTLDDSGMDSYVIEFRNVKET